MPSKKKRTRRRPGEGSFKVRSNGTIEYRVSVGSAVKSFYGQTRDEAEGKYQSWVAEHPHGPPTIDQQQLLNDLMAIWIETTIKPPNGAPSTYADYKRLIKQHIATRIGRVKLYDLKLYAINDFLKERFETTGHGRTVEKLRNIIRAALAYAVKGGTLTSNPAEHAIVPAFQRRKPKPLTLPQSRALIEAAAGRLDLRKPYRTTRTPKDSPGKKYPPIDPRLFALYLLAITTGLRKGELLGLQWGDMDGSKLSVQRAVDIKGVIQPRTKTEASTATIIIDDITVEALAAHRRQMQTESHQEGWKPDGLIFSTSIGTVISQRNLDRHFKTVLEAAGLPPIRFHDLRHSAGTLMIEDGHNLAHVSAAMRHANPSITAKIYVHGNTEGAGRAIAGVSKRLRDEK